jgi:hypothetical protein
VNLSFPGSPTRPKAAGSIGTTGSVATGSARILEAQALHQPDAATTTTPPCPAGCLAGLLDFRVPAAMPGRSGEPASRAHSPATHSAISGRGEAWRTFSSPSFASEPGAGSDAHTHARVSRIRGRGSQAQARFAIRCFDQVASLHPSETLLRANSSLEKRGHIRGNAWIGFWSSKFRFSDRFY